MSPLKPNSLNEKDLIQLSIKGDRLAQRDLFDMYSGKMLALCQRYARHRSEAEDILQEGFIKIYKNLEQFSFSGSFEGWMRRIFVNVAIKKMSKKSFQNEQIGIQDFQEQTMTHEPEVLHKLLADEILVLVDELPEGYKVVFNLYAIEGYSHREISELLKIEESTSRSQLVKARRMLQSKIKDLKKIAV